MPPGVLRQHSGLFSFLFFISFWMAPVFPPSVLFFFSLSHSILIYLSVTDTLFISIHLFRCPFQEVGYKSSLYLEVWGPCIGLIDGLATDVQPPQETQTRQLFSSWTRHIAFLSLFSSCKDVCVWVWRERFKRRRRRKETEKNKKTDACWPSRKMQ